MTTPTSPEPLPSAEPGNLAPAIDAIAGGEFSRSRLAALSDLDRNRAAYLRERWLEIPDTERHALMLALAELADESLDFNFNRVYRIALEDSNPVIRQLAIADLWEDSGRDLPLTYVQLLRSDPSDDVRAAAAAALFTACDAIAGGESDVLDREMLIELFSSLIEDPAESPLVRRRSLGAVAAFDADPRVGELIRLGLDDEDQTVVAGAVYAMGRTSSDRWLPELFEYIKSEDAELRFEAARAAGLLGEADIVPELAELVYDPDAEVRAVALEALGSIGGPAAIRALRQVEQDEELEELELVDGALDAALLTVDPLERQP
jgi:HEAT repeat protein